MQPPPAAPQLLPLPTKVTPPPTERAADRDATVRLSIDQIVNAVLVGDPKLRAGFEAINQANADALTASLRPNPTLMTDALMLPLTRPFTPDQQGGPPQQDAQVTFPIDWYVFGKRAAAMAAARLGVRVSEADFADQVRLRVNEATLAYYDVLEAKGLLDLAKQDVENLARAEDITRRAVEGGGRARVDLDRVRLDLLKSRQAARDAETVLVTAKAKLRAMIGRAESDPAFDVAGTLDARLTAEPPPVEEAFALATKNRPDLNSLQWQVAQNRANVESERRKAYPDLAPMLGYTHQYQRTTIGFPDADSWNVGVTMSLPVFNRNQGNRAKAASTVAQKGFEYQAALANLRADVETVAQEYRAARANAEAIAGEQLALAAQYRDTIDKAFAAGGQTLLALLDAQRNYRETYRAYVTARAAYWRAVTRYASVIGQQITK